MSAENVSRLSDSEVFPGDTYITTTTTETTYITKPNVVQDHDVQTSTPGSSSDHYGTNPTTEHHYGENIGTCVYEPGVQNVARTTYAIHESDFGRTAPDSGEGIHAYQYHGRELGSIPLGTTTIIHDSSAASPEIDPEVHARILESEKHLAEGQQHVQRQVLHEQGESLAAGERKSELGNIGGTSTSLGGAGGGARADLAAPRVGAGVTGVGVATMATGISQHDRDLQRDREVAIANERERITRERIDTKKGSVHGLFGHGRYRDAVFVGRDTDATDFGNKTEGLYDAHRDSLSTSGSEHDRLIGKISGRERLAREQDAKFSSLLGSQLTSGDAPRYSTTAGPTTSTYASATYAGEHNTIPRADVVASPGPTDDERDAVQTATHDTSRAKEKSGVLNKIFGKLTAPKN